MGFLPVSIRGKQLSWKPGFDFLLHQRDAREYLLAPGDVDGLVAAIAAAR